MKKANYSSIHFTTLVISFIGMMLFTQSCKDSTVKARSLYKKGNEFRHKKRYREAFELYQRAANEGNCEAMNCIGWMYQQGQGVSVDYQKAMEWYQKGSKAGSTAATTNIGWMYQHGEEVKKDYQTAMEWYNKAVTAGSIEAMRNIAAMYEQGTGVKKDMQKAADWNKKATEKESK